MDPCLLIEQCRAVDTPVFHRSIQNDPSVVCLSFVPSVLYPELIRLARDTRLLLSELRTFEHSRSTTGFSHGTVVLRVRMARGPAATRTHLSTLTESRAMARSEVRSQQQRSDAGRSDAGRSEPVRFRRMRSGLSSVGRVDDSGLIISMLTLLSTRARQNPLHPPAFR